MGLFDVFKSAVGGSMKKYSGQKDFLEAVCAASAIVAAADGEVSDDEILAAVTMAKDNETLRSAYPQSEIEEVMDRMLKRAKTSSGRAGLNRELEDIASKDIQIREDAYLAALDVAQADGSVGPQERAALAKVAARLGVNAGKFD